MGRHSEYEKPDGTVMKFDRFVAHSLLPKYVYERVERVVPPDLEIDKETLIDLMRSEDEDKKSFLSHQRFSQLSKVLGMVTPITYHQHFGTSTIARKLCIPSEKNSHKSIPTFSRRISKCEQQNGISPSRKQPAGNH